MFRTSNRSRPRPPPCHPRFRRSRRGGLPVQPVSGTTFDVLYSSDANIHDFWCAAGNYAARKLGARSATRVYRISEPPRRAGQGIRFSLDPGRHGIPDGAEQSSETTTAAFRWRPPRTSARSHGRCSERR